MTVQELIDLLKNKDPNLRVMVSGYEGGVNDLEDISEIEVALNVNTEWYYGKHEQTGFSRDTEGKEIVKAVLL